MPPNVPQTLLPLESFREAFGFHHYFFYSLANKLLPITDSSDQLVAEYTWQRPNAAARSDYRQAIAVAEQKLSTALGYDVSTRYRQQVLPAWQNQGRGYSGYGPINGYGGYGGYGGRWGVNVAYLQVGKLQRIATVTYEPLDPELDMAVTYSDENNDLIKDTFTGTFADTTTDPASVIAAFTVADRVGQPKTHSDPVNWQIRPATVVRLDASTLQVTGPSQLLVKPGLYEKVTPSAGYNSTLNGLDSSGSLDPNETATNFVAGLTLYKKVYSAENQATFVRRYAGTEDTFQVDATILNADMGQVQVNLAGCYPASNLAPSLYPGGPAAEEIRINYEAGATAAELAGQAQYLPYQTDWDTVVARFAAAELATDPAATQRRNPQLFYWREDLAMIGNANTNNLYRVSNDVLNNGFKNTRRGAVEAWQAVVSLAQFRAIQT
jgi:hypothetical protein